MQFTGDPVALLPPHLKEPRVPASRVLPDEQAEPEPPPAGELSPAPKLQTTEDRIKSESRPLSDDEKALVAVKDFIKKSIKYPDSIEIVASTNSHKVKGANGKPGSVIRVVFNASDANGRQGLQDFLFVIQKGEVTEHAPTAEFIKAEQARRARMLQLAQRDLAALQQVQGLADSASLVNQRGGWNRRGYNLTTSGGGTCLFHGNLHSRGH
jgi:hypothetical protein